MFRWLINRFFEDFAGKRCQGETRLQEPLAACHSEPPRDSAAFKQQGDSFLNQGKWIEAAIAYRQAISHDRGNAEAHLNLGYVLMEQQAFAEANTSLLHAIGINPQLPDAFYFLGIIATLKGRKEEAIQSYQKAIELKPDFFEACNALCVLLRETGHLEEAASACGRTVELQPDNAEAHAALADILMELGRFADALTHYHLALSIKPDYPEAQGNMGNILFELGRPAEALACYRNVLASRPDDFVACNNLGNVFKDLGQLDEASSAYRRALEIKPDFSTAFSNLLFIHNYLEDQSPGALLSEARRFDQLTKELAKPYATWSNSPDPDRCLRVGLVSADLRKHPVGFFLDSVLSALASDPAGRLQVFAYHNHSAHDAVTERLRSSCHAWHCVVGLSDEGLAQLVRSDCIDILIDLSGHTAQNRLPMFAWKPAPVQITWLGYFATTGVSAIDYLVADPWTLPESEEVHFSESIWRLPETRLCFTQPSESVGVSPLPALRNGYVTFGCFNNLTKMNDAVVELWARVLAAVPDSRLFLKARQLQEASIREQIIARYAAHGIGRERLILEGPSPRASYLATYRQVDIAFDPFPYTGGATSAEALWMGVPVLTLAGTNFLSRQGVGLLMNAGLEEWIASDADDYVARAVSHAKDLENLDALRHRLRNRVLGSPIFNARRFAAHFSSALCSMWQLWCSQGVSRTND